jgi:hypothetical protein
MNNAEPLVLDRPTTAGSKPEPFTSDPRLDPQVITFLKGLNTGGPGLETLTPLTARQVLAGAPAAVDVDLSGIEVREITIRQDGYKVPLHLVRPARRTEYCRYFLLHDHRRHLCPRLDP